jgi:hypothetical protein
MVKRGFRLALGFCNTIWMRRRISGRAWAEQCHSPKSAAAAARHKAESSRWPLRAVHAAKVQARTCPPLTLRSQVSTRLRVRNHDSVCQMRSQIVAKLGGVLSQALRLRGLADDSQTSCGDGNPPCAAQRRLGDRPRQHQHGRLRASSSNRKTDCSTGE